MKVAIVSSLSGDVYVEREGQEVRLEQGAELTRSDLVRTEPEGKIELRFLDDSIIELGPATQILIADFIFDPSGETEPAFGLHMVGGVVRSISGKIVEQNPESFKLTSPLGAVGIRGTETLHVIEQGSEIHSIINMEAGHTVVISTPDGSSIILTQSLKGVSISGGGMMERDVTPDWINEYMQQLGSGDGMTSGGEAPRGFYVIADAAFLSGMDVPTAESGMAFVGEEQLDALMSALDEIGVDTEALEAVLAELTSSVSEEAFTNDTAPGAQAPYIPSDNNDADTGGATPDPGPEPGTDGRIEVGTGTSGNDVIERGGFEFNVSGGEGNDSITVYGDVDGSVIHGDKENDLYNQNGGNDVIRVVDHGTLGAGNFTAGSIYGDADTLNGNSQGGNDSIYVQGNMTGTSAIYGDAYEMNSTSSGGADTIEIGGSVGSGSSIYGDAYQMNVDSSGGNDTIKVGSLDGGSIYGDAYEMNADSSGGADRITVGTMSSGNIYGDAFALNANSIGGSDSIFVNSLSGGSIYGDSHNINSNASAGNDYISVVSMSGGIIYGDAYSVSGEAGNDTIAVGSMSGGIIYGDAQHCGGGTMGHDSITINGSFSDGIIYGDSQSVNLGHMGDDTITISGNMTGGTIYGDAASGESISSMGDNTINVNGIMSGGSIYANTANQALGGNNTLYIGNYAGGEIYLAGNSLLTLDNLSGSGSKNIHFSAGSETVGIGGMQGDVTLNMSGFGSGSDVMMFSSEYSDFFSSNHNVGETITAVSDGNGQFVISLSYGGSTLTLLFNTAVEVVVGDYSSGSYTNSLTSVG